MPQPYWDIYLILGAFSTFTYFYVAAFFSRRWKQSGAHLTAIGFLLFLLGLGVLQGVQTIQAYYTVPELLYLPLSFGRTGIYFFIAGMTSFVVLAEVDKKRHQQSARKGFFKYTISLMLIVLAGVLVPIQIIMVDDYLIYVVFGYTIPVFSFFTFVFIKQFSRLQSIRAKHSGSWILLGIICSFLGLILYNNWIWAQNNPAIPYMNSGCMLCAAIMMTQGWKHLPSLSELEWLSSLELVVVIHHGSSIPIFDFNFQQGSKTKTIETNFIDLYGSMIGGIDAAIGEILASKGHIKEICHENKTLAFTSGRFCLFILFVSSHFEETRFRLERFALDFEEQFSKKLAGAYNTEITQFNAAKSLIAQHFS
jgi:hypothetical protein